MSRSSQVVVLAEDERHQAFVRRYLYRLNYRAHDIRFEKLPGGRGCGEQWVRERYASAVGAYRARATRAATALVVVVDADIVDVVTRLEQLRSALADAHIAPRADDERIAHFIPKRHIETWVLCLTGKGVDEQTNYKSNLPAFDELAKHATLTLHEWTRKNAQLPDGCVPSLRKAIPELKRLG